MQSPQVYDFSNFRLLTYFSCWENGAKNVQTDKHIFKVITKKNNITVVLNVLKRNDKTTFILVYFCYIPTHSTQYSVD